MPPKAKKSQFNCPQTPRLPLHQVWPIALAQREVGGKVVRQVRGLLNGFEDSGIDVLLVAFASVRSRFLLYFTNTESIPNSSQSVFCYKLGKMNLSLLSATVELLLLGLLNLLLTREVFFVELLHVDTSQVDRGRGRDHVSRIYAAERNTVDLEGTCNEKNTVSKALEINDTLSTESAGEDDQDRAGDKRRAENGGPEGFADLQEISMIVPSSNLIPRSEENSFSGGTIDRVSSTKIPPTPAPCCSSSLNQIEGSYLFWCRVVLSWVPFARLVDGNLPGPGTECHRLIRHSGIIVGGVGICRRVVSWVVVVLILLRRLVRNTAWAWRLSVCGLEIRASVTVVIRLDHFKG